MKTQTLLRKIHHWRSMLIMVQMGIVISAGLLLSLKKENVWIQPATIEGITPEIVPTRTIAELFEIAKAGPTMELSDWSTLSRVDFKPNKGVVKFVAANNWEMQIDANTGEVLHLAFRRSDIIEGLHDGSFFSDWIKTYIFFPSGLVLLILWGSGIYLFFLPHVKRAMKVRKGKLCVL